MSNLWTTTFHRSNFNFGRKIEQTAEVVFECDSEDNADLEAAAWAALREQVGWTTDQRLPMNKGFSSVLGGFDFEKIVVPHIDREVELPEDDKPVIGCIFTVPPRYENEPERRYRATSFYKIEKNTEPLNEFIREMWIEEGRDPDAPRYNIITCLPSEAHLVSGSGVGGTVTAISNITILGMVQWDDLEIKQQQGEYEERIANMDVKENIMENNFTFQGSSKKRLLAEIGL